MRHLTEAQVAAVKAFLADQVRIPLQGERFSFNLGID